ncbi:hypothetical protein [Homoserinibacter sp. YIM 151385]|uniref:hypothetical protein n=1 Tax=Homoserinibacter sp. YIM 151385 TaxID=2985506 RepID=UPI0022F0D5C8|nr:hypothetical protein [Homoserinibacter sp. YIM 151385]WBU37455.1 hypothetical protein OF852_11100 [Homoserinibacter sp. YIM 151385]
MSAAAHVPAIALVDESSHPPVSSATAAIGASSLVVTWNLSAPLTVRTTPLLLTLWLPRNGGGPIQLGAEIMPPATSAFCVDFEHRRITRDTSVSIRVSRSRIVALFPTDWVHDLDPIEVSHTGISIASPAPDSAPRLGFRLDAASEEIRTA